MFNFDLKNIAQKTVVVMLSLSLLISLHIFLNIDNFNNTFNIIENTISIIIYGSLLFIFLYTHYTYIIKQGNPNYKGQQLFTMLYIYFVFILGIVVSSLSLVTNLTEDPEKEDKIKKALPWLLFINSLSLLVLLYYTLSCETLNEKINILFNNAPDKLDISDDLDTSDISISQRIKNKFINPVLHSYK